MENVFHLPPAIVESVAMFSPEAIVILLVPLILMFPVISKVISSIKHRNLIIRLQQEGRIKEILASVGDYVKKDEVEEEKEIEIQETTT
jgi:multidrug efflux pump subunit AcrA (membrane-fusion protein)